MEQYSTFDIARILEIPRDRIHDWMRRGFISPSIVTAHGHGSKNLFSRWDVYGIALFHNIVKGGTSREWAKKVFQYWQKNTLKLPIIEAKNMKSFVCAFHPQFRNYLDSSDVLQFEESISEHYSILREEDKDNVIPIYTGNMNGGGITIKHWTWEKFQDMRIINLRYLIANVDGAIDNEDSH